MKRVTKVQFITIAGAFFLAAAIYWLPKTPTAISKNLEENSTPSSSESNLTNEAIGLVFDEKLFMQGIMGLREVLAKDRTNKPAILALGLFSIQSGQYDKATERFSSLLKMEEGLNVSTDVAFLAKTYHESGLLNEIIKTVEKYKSTQKENQQMVDLLNNIIKEFKTYKQ